MSDLLIGALGVLLATDPPAALSNLVTRTTGVPLAGVAAAELADPVMVELRQLMADDDAAQDKAQKLLDEAENAADPLTAPSALTVRGRIDELFKPVRERYQEFVRKHPDHAKGHMAYASFLHDTGGEEEAIAVYEKARSLDPKDPAAWNNLANIYAHIGPVEKSFPYYDEAIRLAPDEPTYQHNFGTLVFLFRRDATNYFRCDEQAVFTKALSLYDRAVKLDPRNFPLASDVAQTFYGIKPPPTATPDEARAAEIRLADQAMASWTNAMGIARDGVEREGVHLHLARWNLRVGRHDPTRRHLASVTNEMYLQMKQRLERNLAEKLAPAVPFDAPAAAPKGP